MGKGNQAVASCNSELADGGKSLQASKPTGLQHKFLNPLD
jgi:hypothetical protein